MEEVGCFHTGILTEDAGRGEVGGEVIQFKRFWIKSLLAPALS